MKEIYTIGIFIFLSTNIYFEPWWFSHAYFSHLNLYLAVVYAAKEYTVQTITTNNEARTTK